MIPGTPAILEICPCSPSKKYWRKIKIPMNYVSHYTWKSQSLDMTYGSHLLLFLPVQTFMKFVILHMYQFPSLLSPIKDRFKSLWTYCFSPYFPCTYGAAFVTKLVTTWIHYRGPEFQPVSWIYDILNIHIKNSFASTRFHDLLNTDIECLHCINNTVP